jgi:glycosyltransferase involved in cell wall biosynthesis
LGELSPTSFGGTFCNSHSRKLATVKILHITPSYKPAFVYGGPIISIAQLCEAEVALGQVVKVSTTLANGVEELRLNKDTIEGVSVSYYQRWTGDHSHFSPGLLRRIFMQAPNYDIVHIHSWWNLVTIPAVFLAWIRGVKPILSPRGMLSPYTLNQSRLKRYFHQIIGKWLLQNTILHATSQQELMEALEVVPGWRHFVLPNIIELPEPGQYQAKSSNSDVFQIIFLSRIHPKKGIEFLLAVLAQLEIPFHVQIIGEGELEYTSHLKQIAKSYGIDTKLDWLGWKEGAEKFEYLANSDLFVLPSYNENFANVVLESLSVGTPVMISNQVGLSDYVQSVELGWVIPLEKNLWVKALDEACLARQLREDIRIKALALIHQDFGAENLAKKYIEAYQKFCPQ